MAMEATQTRITLWTVSRAGAPRSMRLAAATGVEANAAQRQPPLMAKARTEPAVHIDGRVGPPLWMCWSSAASGVSRMPVSAMVRSTVRKRLVQAAALWTRGRVASVQTNRTQ